MPITAIRHIVAASLAFGLGVMWLWAGLTKLRSPLSLGEVRSLVRGPAWLLVVIARGLPFAEVALAAALLTRLWVRSAAMISVALLASFTVVLGFEYFREPLAGVPARGDCGCFGKKRRQVIAASKFPKQEQIRATVEGIAARNVVRPLIFAVIAWAVASAAR